MPRLLLKPAQLTRDYLEGRRATQIPPLRLFLVAVLVFFLAGSVSDMFGPETDLATQQATQLSVRDATGAVSIKIDKSDKTPGVLSRWFIPRVQYAATHQREFKMAIEEWLHRVAILLLPVVALLMTALFAFQRRFYVYDHVIFSMHALSFLFCCSASRPCWREFRLSATSPASCSCSRRCTCSSTCGASTASGFSARCGARSSSMCSAASVLA